MTIKLYESDPLLRIFDATVLSCTEKNDHYLIELDQTAFYPEGGGQPADNGRIDGAEVFDVHEKNGIIYHYSRTPIELGKTVSGKVDGLRRDDLTQQHSGEHVLSGLIHKRYGYDNVGFHMGALFTEIDFSGRIPEEDIMLLEDMANRYIQEDHEVVINVYPSFSEVPFDYRSKKEIHGEIRIVEFPGADTCACCGTHVRRTGEIGLVKIVSSANLREGTRLEIICGERARRYLGQIFDRNHSISALLSAKMLETDEAVKRLLSERDMLKERVKELSRLHFESIASGYSGDEDALLFMDGLDSDSIRELCVMVMEKTSGLVSVFSGNDESGYRYAIGKTGSDIRAMVKAFNAALSGRGGGRDPFFCQGSVSSDRDSITAYLKNMN
ncbi:MAG: alanyl-tRNA editing protein [Clostridia bacterium]|nr:alanyl-tRNA editing protein [Clostridia bacterium]